MHACPNTAKIAKAMLQVYFSFLLQLPYHKLLKIQVNSHFKKQNSNINQCSPFIKHPMWAGRLAWLGRWLYEPKVAGPSPARPTSFLQTELEIGLIWLC